MRLFWRIVALFRRDQNEYLEMSSERRQMNVRYDIAAVFVLFMATPAFAQITWTGPKLTPAEAAHIMARVDSPANRTNVCLECKARGPVYVTTSARTPAPGPWEFPKPAPPRRLDGTLIDPVLTIRQR